MYVVEQSMCDETMTPQVIHIGFCLPCLLVEGLLPSEGWSRVYSQAKGGATIVFVVVIATILDWIEIEYVIRKYFLGAFLWNS